MISQKFKKESLAKLVFAVFCALALVIYAPASAILVTNNNIFIGKVYAQEEEKNVEVEEEKKDGSKVEDDESFVLEQKNEIKNEDSQGNIGTEVKETSILECNETEILVDGLCTISLEIEKKQEEGEITIRHNATRIEDSNNDNDNNNNDKNSDNDNTEKHDQNQAIGNITEPIDNNSTRPEHNRQGPDRDCLFNPSLPKCAAIDGKCPDGFFINEDDQCVPEGGCPDGYHWVEDDETGTCYPNSKGCPDGMIFTPDKKGCEYKEYVCNTYPELNECKEVKGSVSINIRTDKETYNIAETVKITIQNDGSKIVSFPDSALGLKIKSLDNGEVYGFVAAQAITELKPGQSETFEWKQQNNEGQQVKAGKYSAIVSSDSTSVNTNFKIIEKGKEKEKGLNVDKFIVNVKVINKSDKSHKGSIEVVINNEQKIKKTIQNVKYPAHSTVNKAFEFKASDVPVGTSFSAYLRADDGIRFLEWDAYGQNSPEKRPETVHFTIYNNDDSSTNWSNTESPYATINTKDKQYKIGLDYTISCGDDGCTTEKNKNLKDSGNLKLKGEEKVTVKFTKCPHRMECMSPDYVYVYLVKESVKDMGIVRGNIDRINIASTDCYDDGNNCENFTIKISAKSIVKCNKNVCELIEPAKERIKKGEYKLVIERAYDEGASYYISKAQIK